MRLLALSDGRNGLSINNNIPKIRSTIDCAEERKDRVVRLRSIQSRLKGVDFGKALALIGRS